MKKCRNVNIVLWEEINHHNTNLICLYPLSVLGLSLATWIRNDMTPSRQLPLVSENISRTVRTGNKIIYDFIFSGYRVYHYTWGSKIENFKSQAVINILFLWWIDPKPSSISSEITLCQFVDYPKLIDLDNFASRVWTGHTKSTAFLVDSICFISL